MTAVFSPPAELVLAPEHLKLVQKILRKHAPRHRAFAFGSRVVTGAQDRKRLKPHSDLDLALEGPALPLEKAFALRDALSESDLPMRVDVISAADIPASWKLRTCPL